jgi:SAM-dependent methyltransferase
VSDDLVAALERQAAAWSARPLVRRLYREWHEMIRDHLADVPGPTVELGSGFGALRETIPAVVLTDVEQTPWSDAVVDAEHLPYVDGAVANLVLVDVFHHLARPSRFLDEARRVLAPGGRVLILDPYCSPVSTAAYKLFHRERTDLRGPAFDDDPRVAGSPLESNQARSTLIFFRQLDRFQRGWPELAIVERQRLSLLLYPLSGGFAGRPLVPYAACAPLAAVERSLRPTAALLAFRCLVVLERAARSPGRTGA